MQNERQTITAEKLRQFLAPKSTRISIICICIIIFIVIPIALAIYNSRFTATVKLTVAPYDAVVTINGKYVKPNSSVRLEPGQYTAIITRNGFFSYAESFSLSDGDEYPILSALEPSEESTKNWYSEHEDDDSIASGIASAEYEKESISYADKYPISKMLPIFEDFYRIDYGLCQTTKDEFCILLTAIASARSSAANRLMGISGVDPAKYHIEYLQYSYPFSDFHPSANTSGTPASEADLSSARSAVENFLAPYNAKGYNFTFTSISIPEPESYPSYAIVKFAHHLYGDGINTYKLILQHQDNGWAFVTAPKLVFSYLDYENLPREVIFDANH